jgi:hypothetical protein
MGWNQIEHEIVEVDFLSNAIPVKKQVWNGTEFIPVTMYRRNGVLSDEKQDWLFENFGHRGPRWDFSQAGNFYVMDEKVYMWFHMKWGNK